MRFEFGFGRQPVFPVALKRSGYQTIFRFNGMVLACGAFGVNMGAFQSLLLLFWLLLPFQRLIFRGGQADFQRRRLQGFKNKRRDARIQRGTGQGLTMIFPVIDHHPVTTVTEVILPLTVMRRLVAKRRELALYSPAIAEDCVHSATH